MTRSGRAPATLPVPVGNNTGRRRRHAPGRFGQFLEDLTFIICILGLAGSVIVAVVALLGYI